MRVIRVHHRLLGILREEIARMAHQVLVDGRVLRDEEDDGLLAPAPGAPGLLPEAGHRTRVADE